MLIVFISICIILLVINCYYFIKKYSLESYIIFIYGGLLLLLFIMIAYFDFTIPLVNSIITTIAFGSILLFPILIS